jgi:hypothetical protein
VAPGNAGWPKMPSLDPSVPPHSVTAGSTARKSALEAPKSRRVQRKSPPSSAAFRA